jgi:hypothetical protein
MGRVFMADLDDPFRCVDDLLDDLENQADLVMVDFHSEATSEKVAFGWHLDGRVAAVIGTHTHVQTADERVLPGGTAYITDAGMTGPHDSVIGVRSEDALIRFRTALPSRFQVAKGGVAFNGLTLELDEQTGLATGIERHFIRFTTTPPDPEEDEE